MTPAATVSGTYGRALAEAGRSRPPSRTTAPRSTAKGARPSSAKPAHQPRLTACDSELYAPEAVSQRKALSDSAMALMPQPTSDSATRSRHPAAEQQHDEDQATRSVAG